MNYFDQTKLGLCGLFWNWGMVVEQRADPRFSASAPVRITWTDSRGSHEVAATFADISRGGAAIRTAGLPPAVSTSVRIHFERGRNRRGIEAEVRGVHPSANGTTLIRLIFRARCSNATVEAIAGVTLRRRSRHIQPAAPENLEARQLLATVAMTPPAAVAVEVGPVAPSPAPLASSLYNLANDALLSSLLYSTPSRMASGIAADGAVGVNADFEAGKSTTWYIEQQRYGADFVQAGLIQGNAPLAASGWKILDWGFAREAADGSFAGTGDAFHSTSMFVEAGARALLLTVQSGSADAPQLVAKYLTKLEAAAQWLTLPSVKAKGDLNDAPYTHRNWLLAAALGETAAVLRTQAGTSPADPLQMQAATFDQIAATYANRGLALQTAEGMNPEKGGADTSYQAYGILLAERYEATCPSATMQGAVSQMVVLGLDWLSARINAQGQVDTSGDTRTGVEDSRSGTTKSIDYKTMIQAFSCATTTTGDPAYRDVAQALAVGRGWIK